MSTEQSNTIEAPASSTSDTQSSWGAADGKPSAGWSRRKTIAAVAIAAGVAGIGGAVIWASSGSSTATTGQGFGGTGGPGGGARSGASGALPNALHGEYVASDGNGGYETDLMQLGKVTAVGPTSVTALSSDGFSQVYTVDAATAVGTGTGTSSLATGDTVTIVAKTTGTAATAKTVTEGTTAGAGPAL
ncbi:MAG: hypothetical protein JWQ81_1971 [Amycolatopsis sp.]|jgi:hypothetical protein|uniref:hypothetical protein n=1 Tax=Amycolatopsis sp. TaxID=37632 RepID=UPI002631792D|nr:hypothetical protein [Amycolatopsis sp.]MCU1681232.1 hypothetical protein [Amycolatopsis sp.]